MRNYGAVGAWWFCSVLVTVGLLSSTPAYAGRPGPGDPSITAEVVVTPREVAPGENVVVQLLVTNRSQQRRDLLARGKVFFERTEIQAFDFPALAVESGERRSVDHIVTLGEDARRGAYAVSVEVIDATTREPVTRGGSGFVVGIRSPIRMSLFLQPHQTHPGGGILLHVGLQNLTDAPLVLVQGGRVTKDRNEVGVLRPRRVRLAPNERMGLMIPFAVPEDAALGVYGVQVVAGLDLREPMAIQESRFLVVRRAAAMVDAAVRPNVTVPGETVSLAARVQSNLGRNLRLQQWGVLRRIGDQHSVRRFRGQSFELPPHESILNKMRYTIPDGLPPGRYALEVWIGHASGGNGPIDSSIAEFTVRPVRPR